jgi:hypothetical protein
VLQSTDEAIVMSWGGEIELRNAFLKNKDLDVRFLGSKLGRWIGCMHRAGVDNPEIKDWTNEVVTGLIPNEEGLLRKYMSEAGSFDQSTMDKAARIFKEPASLRTLAIWDFRPMNTLLRTADDPNRPTPTVIDWEVSLYQDPAYDIRMWAGEAIVLEAQHGSERGLLKSFLQAYRESAGPAIMTDAYVCKIALMIGMLWFLLMPCAIWDVKEEEGERWKATALEYVRAAVDQDMAWLAKSPLSPLLG